MEYLNVNNGTLVANAAESERSAFYKRTFLHLGGAILAFAILETLLISSGIAEAFVGILQGSKWTWLVVLGLFMVVSYVADKWARSPMSREMQYAGLGLFTVAEAIVFMPIIYMALNYAPASVLPTAALMTFMLAGGLLFTAFTTKKDFSFLAPALTIGFFVAMGLILGSIIFGFQLGIIFFAAMILLSAGVILYQASQMIHEYHTDQHVAASLGLFSSIGLMFWYMVQFLMALTGND